MFSPGKESAINSLLTLKFAAGPLNASKNESLEKSTNPTNPSPSTSNSNFLSAASPHGTRISARSRSITSQLARSLEQQQQQLQLQRPLLVSKENVAPSGIATSSFTLTPDANKRSARLLGDLSTPKTLNTPSSSSSLSRPVFAVPQPPHRDPLQKRDANTMLTSTQTASAFLSSSSSSVLGGPPTKRAHITPTAVKPTLLPRPGASVNTPTQPSSLNIRKAPNQPLTSSSVPSGVYSNLNLSQTPLPVATPVSVTSTTTSLPQRLHFHSQQSDSSPFGGSSVFASSSSTTIKPLTIFTGHLTPPFDSNSPHHAASDAVLVAGINLDSPTSQSGASSLSKSSTPLSMTPSPSPSQSMFASSSSSSQTSHSSFSSHLESPSHSSSIPSPSSVVSSSRSFPATSVYSAELSGGVRINLSRSGFGALIPCATPVPAPAASTPPFASASTSSSVSLSNVSTLTSAQQSDSYQATIEDASSASLPRLSPLLKAASAADVGSKSQQSLRRTWSSSTNSSAPLPSPSVLSTFTGFRFQFNSTPPPVLPVINVSSSASLTPPPQPSLLFQALNRLSPVPAISNSSSTTPASSLTTPIMKRSFRLKPAGKVSNQKIRVSIIDASSSTTSKSSSSPSSQSSPTSTSPTSVTNEKSAALIRFTFA